MDGWKKQLEGEDTTDKVRRRSNNNLEYTHEAGLFQRHSEVYTHFNETIRGFVKTAMSTDEQKQDVSKVDSVKDRGIRLGEWRTFVKKVKNWVQGQDGGARLSW